MNRPTNDHSDSDAALPLVDAYLAELHAGRRPDRQHVLAAHPELASFLDCLEALEQLAPSSEMRANPADEAATLTAVPGAREAAGPACLGEQAVAFGKYELLGEIGRGGMGVVYKARQMDLDRPVALKMVLAGCLASPDHVSRFQDEARATAGLHHPHIVTIYEAGQVHGQPYFAMQYVDGPSLARVLQQGPLPPEQAARCLAAIARAVAHLHAHGIVHRDLKPSNILLDEQGQPYVTDFGLAKLLAGDSHRTSTGAILGTASYMAPEQAAGGRAVAVGPLSDVYSLGALLYETLTGRPPFREETALDTLVQVLEGEPVRPSVLNPGIPRELEMICLRCLEKAPEDRYPSATAVAEEVERFLKGEEIETQHPGPWQRLRRWGRREPALVYRLGALALCLVILQVNYHVAGNVALDLHLSVMGVVVLWGLASVVCQRLLRVAGWGDTVRYAWAAADVVLLASLVLLDEAVVSPVVIGFPLLIAASGLWFHVRLVWVTTVLVVVAYCCLVLESLLHHGAVVGIHKHIMFVVGLAVLGFVIAYQVQRVRALSRYYEHRPLP
jgi:eukaryotic-like serine/threonine-protein kinase